MMKGQYAIFRMKKYKGQTISIIEAHNERMKEAYASNPDIDMQRSKLNYHPINPNGRYLGEVDKLIQSSGCRVRKDSVKMIEALITASPEFFEGKKPREVKAFFARAVDFKGFSFFGKPLLSDQQTPTPAVPATCHTEYTGKGPDASSLRGCSGCRGDFLRIRWG